MARSTLTTLAQTIEIDGVTKLNLTVIEQDVDGDYVRELRVTATAEEGQTTNPQVCILRLKSPIKSQLEIVTPSPVIV
jgi:hypothetical protein